MILPEYRVIGCPIYACTQANIRWPRGHYISFQAPKDGVISSFMWQTQGARKNSNPNDGHSGGNFGCYRIRFYRSHDWTAPKGVQLAAGEVTPGELGYYPGRQVGGFDGLNPLASRSGVPDSPELVGGLHVHAWLNRLQALNNVQVYCGTAFVYVDVTADGAPWTVTAGEWILAEIVNVAASPTVNFSLDNNAFSAAAAHPGEPLSRSPLDRLLAVREYLPASQQPNTSKSAGGARGITPFFMLGYADGTWLGQPWYYRGRYTGGLSSTGLFDQDPVNPAAPLPPVAQRGPALLVHGQQRLRQVLTPPADFMGETVDELYLHAWRWTSLTGYQQDKRLGVRIMRVTGVGGRGLTMGLRQVWPPPVSSGADVFRVGGAGPFKAFPQGSFAAFGQDVVAGKKLTITPSNLTSTTSPSLAQFEQAVPVMPYGRLEISPPLPILKTYRYIVEIMAEDGAAFAMQLQKNPARYLNLSRKKSDGTFDTSQGLALMPDGTRRPAINMPQVWACSPTSVPSASEDDALNSGRYYNACGKLYATSETWKEINDHMLPVSLMPAA